MSDLSNLPSDVLNSVPGIMDFGRHWVLTHLEGQLGDFAWKQVVRAVGRWVPAIREADPKELASRIQRMEATLEGFSEELEILRRSGAGDPPDDELREPATQDFIAEAFGASMESPCYEKRVSLGRLVAQRLYSATESPEELYLRQAFAILHRINRRQMHLLATLYLVHQTPMPIEEMSRSDLNAWFDKHLLSGLESLSAEDPDSGDLEYLVTLGALTYSEALGSESYSPAPTHASSIEQNIVARTHEFLSPGGSSSIGAFYRRAEDLLDGKFDKKTGVERIALAPYALTIGGAKIASLVVADVTELFIA